MRAVLTGLGAVGSFGCGGPALAEALRAARPRLSEVDRSAGYHRPDSARRAALVAGNEVATWVPAAMGRRMSPPSKLAVAAARMAVAEAGIAEGEDAAGPSSDGHALTEVVLSTAFGPASFTERLLRGILSEGPETASPFLFAECVANAPAAQVAIVCQARGPNITVTQREAGPLLALGRAAADVASGHVSRALAGAVEEAPPLVHALLDRFGALARPDDDGAESARPFDRRRSGYTLGEGAAVVMIEDSDAARRRGARVLAAVRAWGSGFDPTASPASWGRGHEPLALRLSRMLARAGLAPRDIDLVVSGASGSVAGDRLEALTLRTAWGHTPLPPVVTPKSVTGEYGGGMLGAAVLAAAGAEFGPTAGFETFDPELGITPHAGGALPARPRVLVTSLAAGGAAAWVVLESA
jgi:3-oxoacyl-[acyl-carrier-protein] synthase II